MKLVDFRCDWCGNEVEIFEYDEPLKDERCRLIGCQRPMRRLIGAPHITGTRLYSKHYMGKEATAREIDKKFNAEGSWVPTPREAREISQMTEAGIEPIAVKPPGKEKIARAVEKAYGKMKQEGLDKRA